MPWRTLCGFPPTADTVTLRIPNGAWRPDTVITDYEGTEMFVLLDQTQEMRSYEAVFGDLEGRRLVCIKRHLMQAFWKDGYYFCTYKPNYPGQQPLKERDVDNKKVYPFSYLQVNPMKGRFFYRYFDNQEGLGAPRMRADNPWLGFMVVCCTPMVRCGKWTASFKRKGLHTTPTIHVDQWRNCVDIGPGNDMLAALCMSYVFDRYQCQPFITVFGMDPMEEGAVMDDKSINTQEDPLAGIGDYGNNNKSATTSQPQQQQPRGYQDYPVANNGAQGGGYEDYGGNDQGQQQGVYEDYQGGNDGYDDGQVQYDDGQVQYNDYDQQQTYDDNGMANQGSYDTNNKLV